MLDRILLERLHPRLRAALRGGLAESRVSVLVGGLGIRKWSNTSFRIDPLGVKAPVSRGISKMLRETNAYTSGKLILRPVSDHMISEPIPKFQPEFLLTQLAAQRLFWNYAEESLIGDAISIASRTHRLTATERTLDRYYIRVLLMVRSRERVRTGRPTWLRETIRN
jgi:hypothetical protein